MLGQHWRGPGPGRAGGAGLAGAGLPWGPAEPCGPALPAGSSSRWGGFSARGPTGVASGARAPCGPPPCVPPSTCERPHSTHVHSLHEEGKKRGRADGGSMGPLHSSHRREQSPLLPPQLPSRRCHHPLQWETKAQALVCLKALGEPVAAPERDPAIPAAALAT